MDFNKISAEIDFIGSSVKQVEIKADMIRILNNSKKSFGLDIKCSKPLIKDNQKFGKLLMQVDVSIFKEDEELEPDIFKLIMEGIFKSSKNIEDDKFMELLNVNGGAALYSIARTKMEVLSGLTYSEGKIVLPMINVVQYFAERKTTKED